MRYDNLSFGDWFMLGLFLAPALALIVGPTLILAFVVLQRVWFIFGGFIWIPRKKDLFEKLREVRDEDTKLYGYHGLKHAYSAKDFFRSKPDLLKLNRVRTEIFQMKPIERLPKDKIALYKCLYQEFLTMLYQREILRRAKKWSDEKQNLWLEVCPEPFRHGINPYYFDHLKLYQEVQEWEHAPVKAFA